MKRLLLCALAASAAARAQRPTIDISNARVQAYPIALAPPSGAAEGREVLEVLAADFDRSGLFRLLDPRGFLADPAKEGMTVQTIDFSKWAAIGAQALVKAAASLQGSMVRARDHSRRHRPRSAGAAGWTAASTRLHIGRSDIINAVGRLEDASPWVVVQDDLAG